MLNIAVHTKTRYKTSFLLFNQKKCSILYLGKYLSKVRGTALTVGIGRIDSLSSENKCYQKTRSTHVNRSSF